MKKLRIYCLLTLLFLSFSNCKKDGSNSDNPYGLPNATQNGSMVFACRINGQSSEAKPSIFSQNGNISRDSVTVFAEFGTAYYQRVGIIVYSAVTLNHSYDFSDSAKTRFIYDSDSTCFGVPGYLIARRAFGTITFTKTDTINKIISGTFSFKVAVTGCDTLNFTDGRFDIRYTN
jgi:hypothetical protein